MAPRATSCTELHQHRKTVSSAHLVLACASHAVNVTAWEYPRQICENTEVEVVIQIQSTGKEHPTESICLL